MLNLYHSELKAHCLPVPNERNGNLILGCLGTSSNIRRGVLMLHLPKLPRLNSQTVHMTH